VAGLDILLTNLISPLVLAFALGMIATAVKSELEFPDGVLKFISVYLLFAIGLKGGMELSQVQWSQVAGAIGVTVFLILAIPFICFEVLRRLGKFDVPNAAAIAAHYGSVSSVTFFAALSFANAMNTPAEGFMPALVALMEWGVIVALLIARWHMGKEARAAGETSIGELFLDSLRGRGIILLSGGMTIGFVTGEEGYGQVSPFFDEIFRGMLMLFLLEMGMAAARQMREFAKVGPFMLGFGVLMPLFLGVAGTALGTLAGLSIGGAFVLGAIAASASYIDAPAACRAALPTANPSIYLTSSLAITFPFNLLVGLPVYYQSAKLMAAWF
jgi:hypothetical protein